MVPDEDEAKSVVDSAKTWRLISAKACVELCATEEMSHSALLTGGYVQEAKNLKLVEVDPSDQDALAAVIARSEHLQSAADIARTAAVGTSAELVQITSRACVCSS